MSFFQILGLILGAVRYLPELISLVHSILELINALKGQPGFDQKAALTELKEAIHEVKQNKDTTKLEEIHRKLNTWCVGDVCPGSGMPVEVPK